MKVWRSAWHHRLKVYHGCVCGAQFIVRDLGPQRLGSLNIVPGDVSVDAESTLWTVGTITYELQYRGRGRIHEHKISLRFLGIILRILRLEVSVRIM
jgi:hypothetical protein